MGQHVRKREEAYQIFREDCELAGGAGINVSMLNKKLVDLEEMLKAKLLCEGAKVTGRG